VSAVPPRSAVADMADEAPIGVQVGKRVEKVEAEGAMPGVATAARGDHPGGPHLE
jgi:hypothetical protein